MIEVDIREWRTEDLPVLFRAMKQPEVHQNLRPPSPKSSRKGHYLAVQFRDSTVGGIGFDPTESPNLLDIGFWILTEFENQGIMSLAVQRACEQLRQESPEIQIRASVYNQNPGSIRVLEKNGFTKTAELPRAISYAGKVLDVAVYLQTAPASNL